MSIGKQNKIKIGFTLGDVSGVGPELFHKFHAANKEHPLFEIILVDEHLYEDKNALKNLVQAVKLGAPSKIAGEHAYRTLEKANLMAAKSEIDYLVTLPVAKESLSLAGHKFTGQTEILAHLNNLGREEIEMFFVLDDFRVVLATRHVALNAVSELFKKRLHRVIDNSNHALRKIFKINNPKIAIAGLNPHAGENGILGSEEEEFIKPLIKRYNDEFTKLKNLEGPFPADTMFAKLAHSYLANQKAPYDLYVAAYHDQALSLIKGLGGFRAINLTTGLPYVRVSVDHGTAYDIAGKGIADSEGIRACVDFIIKNHFQESLKKLDPTCLELQV